MIDKDDAGGLPPAVVPKLRNMISFLEAMSDVDELKSIPHWHAHLLTGDRKGCWALYVTRNWRLTFKVDHVQIEIIDLDYQDYH
ncbi:plasmid maintenance system killer protein [Tistrella bauzanensis]|uniref:Plasmid maintenance system killer protein n=1 Tax=Tistrella bauzanensis TaxID=657419 RepID=A0ABQ1IPX7_9PROT|nr:plasmid maintenance system killer protein [Tistrella bauzanensis]